MSTETLTKTQIFLAVVAVVVVLIIAYMYMQNSTPNTKNPVPAAVVKNTGVKNTVPTVNKVVAPKTAVDKTIAATGAVSNAVTAAHAAASAAMTAASKPTPENKAAAVAAATTATKMVSKAQTAVTTASAAAVTHAVATASKSAAAASFPDVHPDNDVRLKPIGSAPIISKLAPTDAAVAIINNSGTSAVAHTTAATTALQSAVKSLTKSVTSVSTSVKSEEPTKAASAALTAAKTTTDAEKSLKVATAHITTAGTPFIPPGSYPAPTVISTQNGMMPTSNPNKTFTMKAISSPCLTTSCNYSTTEGLSFDNGVEKSNLVLTNKYEPGLPYYAYYNGANYYIKSATA